MTYELAIFDDLGRAITGLWESSDPAALQNQLRIYIWLFATGFTGTAAWRAKHRWMRLAMLITNQAVQLAMMTTSFQKLVTILEIPYESLTVFIVSILLSAWIFRFRKPRAYRDLERRGRRAAAPRDNPDELSDHEVREFSQRWLANPEGSAPADPASGGAPRETA